MQPCGYIVFAQLLYAQYYPQLLYYCWPCIIV